MKKLMLLFALFVLLGAQINAQTTISGTVTGTEDGAPIPGVTVRAKGFTEVGTITASDGKYSITVPTGATTLIFSFVGMKVLELPISGTVVNAVLESEDVEVKEIVVVGYGSAKKVGTVVGSVSQVTSSKLEAKPQANVLEAIQGKVPGLQVYTSSGDPGALQTLRLHGIGSLGASTTPLYILDGIAVSDVTFRSINPNDIESISVLKDASSTSIYGSRAANGVIYVTTKHGSSVKSTITVRGQKGVSSLANTDFYDKMMNTDQLFAFWLETGIRTQAQIDAIKANLHAIGQVQGDGSYNSTKWNSYIQPNNRPMFQADIALSGGANTTRYYISGSIYDEAGTAPGTSFKRYGLASSVDSRVNNWLKVGANLRLSLSKRLVNTNFATNALAGGLSFLRQPYYSPYDSTGKELDWIPGGNFATPNYLMKMTTDLYNNYGGIINTYFEIEPIKNLKIKSVPGLDALGVVRNYMRNASYLGAVANGQLGKYVTQQVTATITNTIEYIYNISDKQNLTLLVGHEGIKNDYKYSTSYTTGLKDDRLMQFDNGLQTTFAMTSTSTTSTFLSFFGRAEYSYDSRFFVDASLRNDKSSRFGKANRSANFWSGGFMWNLKNEAFLKTVSLINVLNFKISYGTQGNASIGDYDALATVVSTTNYSTASAWGNGNSGNPDLAWETQKKLTVGINTRLIDRVDLSVEVYNRATENMLMSVPVPATTGYTTVLKNVGTLTNKGVDISLNIDILKGKDYYVGFNTTFNYNSEKVTELFDGRNRWEVANTGVAYVVGKPVMYYYPIFAGINPANGRQQWYVPGTDKDVTTKDAVTEVFNASALTQNTGTRRYAPTSGGFGFSASWKGISLNADFAYVLGKNLISNDRYFSENPFNFAGYNASSNVLEYWKIAGDVVEYPDWKQGQIMQFDTHLIENASFCRLKNLTLSYTIPQVIIQKLKYVQGVKAYITGRNLWTLVNKDFEGIDPEVDSNLTLGRIGNSKQFVFGFELTF